MWMRRLDHSMIFLLIAGTLTPFALLVLDGTLATAVLVAVWAGAAAGIMVELIWTDSPKWVSVGVYLAVGWIGAMAFPAIIAEAGIGAGALIAAGGIMYTVGAVIYATAAPEPAPGHLRLPRDLPRARRRRGRRALRGDRGLRRLRFMPVSATATAVRVEALEPADVEPTADVLNDAFLHDPVWVSIGPRREAHRRFANRTIFRGDRQRVAGTRRAVQGRPRRVGGRRRQHRLRAGRPGRCRRPRWSTSSAGSRSSGRLPVAARLPQRPGDPGAGTPSIPHMYLWFLAVHPDWHGRGVGRALQAELHAESDERGLPTYLETGTEKNVGFYEGDGYAVVGDLDVAERRADVADGAAGGADVPGCRCGSRFAGPTS